MTLIQISSIGAVIGAGLIAQVPIPNDSVEAIGRWPITIALIALAALAVWLAFKSAEKARISQDKAADAILKMAEQLSQRPCIRSREND